MIVEWFYTQAVVFVGWINQNILTWDGPQPVNVWAEIEGMVNNVASVGAWIDWVAIFAALGFGISVWLACLGIKAFRAFIAHAPFVGGSG